MFSGTNCLSHPQLSSLLSHFLAFQQVPKRISQNTVYLQWANLLVTTAFSSNPLACVCSLLSLPYVHCSSCTFWYLLTWTGQAGTASRDTTANRRCAALCKGQIKPV